MFRRILRALNIGGKAPALTNDPSEFNALDKKGDWGRAVLAELKALDEPRRRALQALLQHAASASGARPPKKYLELAGGLVAAVGAAEFAATLSRWFKEIRGLEPHSLRVSSDRNNDTLNGVIWLAARPELSGTANDLVDLALHCYRKIPNVGALSTRAGNACVAALAAMDPLTSVRHLDTLKVRVKYPSARKLIEAAATAAAARSGMDRRALADQAADDFGLNGEGERHIAFNGGHARLRILGDGETDLTWSDDAPGATTRYRAAPTTKNREDAPEGVRDCKKLAKNLEVALATQAARLERVYLEPRQWTLGEWRSALLAHPVLGHVVRRLIWTIVHGERHITGIMNGTVFENAAQNPLDWSPDADGVVRLWHPIDAPADAVLAWRRYLERREIVQPFKQAHREVYILTDAERQTEIYSNRFAAHIVKQHQLAALCQQRDWSYRLQGQFDSWNAPTRSLPHHGYTVEFLLDAGAIDPETSGAGIFLYVATDQVRFLEGDTAVRLSEIPATCFSEVMRDVDLFVGVCSVGNDPSWGDSGPAAHRTYWYGHAFGDLSLSAKLRREQLERVIPALAIRDRLTLADRYLVVRGHLRSYKIHLGSANILMEPNDQYLCIVRGGAGPGKLYLPFTGDGVLPLILSKALLLAADDKITDMSIVNQIRR